ncbi:MAG: peptidoglycan D,D-transpeptidase FtsI family protein [Verrucomicrobiia bacterium]
MTAGAINYRWLWVCVSMLIGAFMLLSYKLAELQVLQHTEYRELADANTQRKYILPAMRGQIKDNRGNTLAMSVPVKTVCADPSLLGVYYPQIAKILAPLLQMNEAELASRLAPRVKINESGQVVTNRYVVLKRKVPIQTYEQIQKVMKSLSFGIDEKKLPPMQRLFYRNIRESAIFCDKVDDQLRVYPNGRLASHIVGYVGMENQSAYGIDYIDIVGIAGIERIFNNQLRGIPGWRVTEKDRRNKEIVNYRAEDVQPVDGANVVLTIDSVLQYILEKEIAEAYKTQRALSVSGVIVRPKTGEILAMATVPNFDPNNPGESPEEYRRNRLIEEVHEPGSTFKIVTISGALNEKRIRLSDVIDCENGRFEYCGRVIRDHGSGHKSLTVEEILEMSSNIGAAKIGMQLGAEPLLNYVYKFGFGKPTGISLPGEVSGIVHPLKDWHKTSILSIPMGHEIAVTPLQVVMAISAIANNGTLMKPMIIDRLEDKDGNLITKYQPMPVREAISGETAKLMVSAMRRVTSSKHGTAQRAALELYTVAGKTGTAEKPGIGGYQRDKNFSTFVGFFPSESPELCIGIFIDEPKEGHLGGVVCAPVFKNVAIQAASYLSIPPDVINDSGEEASPSPKNKNRNNKLGDSVRGTIASDNDLNENNKHQNLVRRWN